MKNTRNERWSELYSQHTHTPRHRVLGLVGHTNVFNRSKQKCVTRCQSRKHLFWPLAFFGRFCIELEIIVRIVLRSIRVRLGWIRCDHRIIMSFECERVFIFRVVFVSKRICVCLCLDFKFLTFEWHFVSRFISIVTNESLHNFTCAQRLPDDSIRVNSLVVIVVFVESLTDSHTRACARLACKRLTASFTTTNFHFDRKRNKWSNEIIPFRKQANTILDDNSD